MSYIQVIDHSALYAGSNYIGTYLLENNSVIKINNRQWIASPEIEVKNNGIYHYVIEYSNSPGNRFYIGFERYDANHTSTSNSSCLYLVSTNIEENKTLKQGIVDLSKNSAGATKYIKLRILNNWENSSGPTEAEISAIYLYEELNNSNTNINKSGIISIGSFIKEQDNDKAKIYNTGRIQAEDFYEI